MPYDSLEAVADVAACKACQTFPRPSVLWEPCDKGPGQLSQVRLGGVWMINGMNVYRALLDYGDPILNVAANSIPWLVTGGAALAWLDRQKEKEVLPGVCSLPEEHQNTGWKDYIVQDGMCVEGTKCKCPMTRLNARSPTPELRKEGLTVFAPNGVSAATSLLMQARGMYLTSAVRNSLAMGLAGGLQTTVTSLFVPQLLLYQVGRTIGFKFFQYLTHQCQSTVGCWPQQPESVSLNGTWNACRMPVKANEGRSPVWFLPPPGLRFKHSKGFCVLDNCKPIDRKAQTVGLVASSSSRYPGKPYLHNCQPLSFEYMTPDQRHNFIQRLQESGIEDEYNLTEARDFSNFMNDEQI